MGYQPLPEMICLISHLRNRWSKLLGRRASPFVLIAGPAGAAYVFLPPRRASLFAGWRLSTVKDCVPTKDYHKERDPRLLLHGTIPLGGTQKFRVEPTGLNPLVSGILLRVHVTTTVTRFRVQMMHGMLRLIVDIPVDGPRRDRELAMTLISTIPNHFRISTLQSAFEAGLE